MCLLVGDDTYQRAVSLATNPETEAAITLFISLPNIQNEDSADDIELGKYFITLITEERCNTWDIVSCEAKIENGIFKMEHL